MTLAPLRLLRTFLFPAFVLLLALLIASCGRLPSTDPPTPTPSPSPSPSPGLPQVASPTPTPVPKPDVAAGSLTLFFDGRPYRVESLLDGATIRYEPWIDYEDIQLVTRAYALARQVIQEDLGIEDVFLPEIYVALPNQFRRFVSEGDFVHPTWLAGLSSYFLRDGEVTEGKLYVNPQATGLVRNIAHELTHLATPGLPTWLNEGVAEYIGSRVELALEPEAHMIRELDARANVRRALDRGELLDIEGLENFPWKDAQTFATLDLAYSQTWQLVEYIARTSSRDGLLALLARYQEDPPEDDSDPFLDTLGVSSDSLWQGFSQDLLHNLTLEEQEGLSLCDLAALGDEAGRISLDWNIFLDRTDQSRPDRNVDRFQEFARRWETLQVRAAELAPVGVGIPIHNLLLPYFGDMVRTMEEFASEDVFSANRMLVAANNSFSDTVGLLREAYSQRSWLYCRGRF